METEEVITNLQTKPKKKIKLIYLWIILCLMFFLLLQKLLVGSFFDFEKPEIIKFEEGEAIKTLAKKLYENKIISSKSLFLTSIIFLHGEKEVDAGFYQFTRKQGDYFVAKRFIGGDFRVESVKITVPEGFTISDISKRLSDNFPEFDDETFIKLAKEKEGYLFPDTYFFIPSAKPIDIVKKLEETFWQKMEESFDIKKDSEEFQDTLILASIVEEEVRNLEDKKIVAGIFLNRLKIGMPLQADSTLAYVTGRDSLSLTQDDLQMENAYNSYKNKGLPPTPISNPGLESLEATLHPTETKYLYFLTDKEGKVYYAKTFEEHKLNKQKYLR